MFVDVSSLLTEIEELRCTKASDVNNFPGKTNIVCVQKTTYCCSAIQNFTECVFIRLF